MTVASTELSQNVLNQEIKHSTAKNTKKNQNNVELIRALTPIAIATIGGIIGLYAIFSQVTGENLTAAMGLSSSAIAGASGLAQSNKND